MAKERTPSQYFIGGIMGGVCVVLFGHPFDTIKVELQMAPKLYKNMFDVSRVMIAKDGPFRLYRGMQAPLATVVPLTAVSFFSYGIGKVLFGTPNQIRLNNIQLILSGMFSGLCTSFVTAPGERIKCVLQTQKSKEPFFKCASRLWQEGGIRNIYLGTCATMLRDMPSYGTYFFTYERLKEILTPPGESITWQPVVAGGFAGIFAWALSLPMDAVKTRLQSAPMGTYEHAVRSVVPLVLKEGGVLILYRGMTPVLIRAFIANAACFTSLELSFLVMDKLSEMSP